MLSDVMDKKALSEGKNMWFSVFCLFFFFKSCEFSSWDPAPYHYELLFNIELAPQTMTFSPRLGFQSSSTHQKLNAVGEVNKK